MVFLTSATGALVNMTLNYSIVVEGLVGVCLDCGVERKRCFVVNFYSNCDLSKNKILWEKLVVLRNSLGGGAWCFISDFNLVLDAEERRDECYA